MKNCDTCKMGDLLEPLNLTDEEIKRIVIDMAKIVRYEYSVNGFFDYQLPTACS